MKKAVLFKPKTGTNGPKFNGRAHIDSLYDSEWEHYSRAFLTVNPRCYSCGSKSEAVDHLRPHKGDEFLFRQLDNHIPLCHRCHNTITSRFDKKYKIGMPIDEKLSWIAQNRKRNLLETRVRVLPRYGK